MIMPYIIIIGMHYAYTYIYIVTIYYIKYFHWMVNGRHEISR